MKNIKTLIIPVEDLIRLDDLLARSISKLMQKNESHEEIDNLVSIKTLIETKLNGESVQKIIDKRCSTTYVEQQNRAILNHEN